MRMRLQKRHRGCHHHHRVSSSQRRSKQPVHELSFVYGSYRIYFEELDLKEECLVAALNFHV